MISTVALIMRMESTALFEGLARCMPLWVADTVDNAPLRNALADESASTSITWFPLRRAELLDAAAVRICVSLDDHYNDYVQAVGYKTLLCFGTPYVPFLSHDLAALGFKHVESSVFGFVAVK